MSTLKRPVVEIGLGGIWEGYGLEVPKLDAMGILPMSILLLVDGDTFEKRNLSRQWFDEGGQKATVRANQLRRLFDTLPIDERPRYIHRGNVAELVTDGAIVLLSPDNHPTRRLVSDHVKTLDSCLLIVGGNSAIDLGAGEDGTTGTVMVHWRTEGRDFTAPIDAYHPEIAAALGPDPTELSCGELAARGAEQIWRTNILVGQWMFNLLLRYLQLPPEEAVQVAEVCVSSKTGFVVPYRRQPLA